MRSSFNVVFPRRTCLPPCPNSRITNVKAQTPLHNYLHNLNVYTLKTKRTGLLEVPFFNRVDEQKAQLDDYFKSAGREQKNKQEDDLIRV